MRVCVFTSNAEIAALDKRELLSQINCPIGEEQLSDLYVVSYVSPATGIGGPRFYVAEPRNRRAAVGYRLLRAVDIYRGIPSVISFMPLSLFAEDLLEVVLGCDPDVVVIHEVRWASELTRVIQKTHPHWACLADGDAWPDVNPGWRKFDPSVKVSIVLPTYNGSKYLHRSIESCLNQTYRKLELIIIDDGSTEDIGKIVDSFDDSRIKFIKHDKNRGVAEALNTGFRNTTGQYLTWTSDDNCYAAMAIEELIRYLQTYRSIDFAYAERYDLDERTPGQGWRIQRTLPASSLGSDCGIGACFLYKRKVYDTIGDYDSTVFLNEDYDYWIRVSEQFTMQRLFKPLYYYRYHEGSLTGKYGGREINRRARLVWQRNQKRRRSLWGKLLGVGWPHGNRELDTNA